VSSPDRWLSALWPGVQQHLPAPPATIVELGCGRSGGFVPRLRDAGYDALGVDPQAPDGQEYLRTEFEQSELPRPVHGLIACTSLHHVADPGEVVARIADALDPGGVLVVVEWDWEAVDEETARWALRRAGPDSWLSRRQEGWDASGQPWETYFRSWAAEHRLHSARDLFAELDQRFERLAHQRGPFFFADLTDTSEADELEAIGSGEIRAVRVDYVGRPASR
jgi:SAM-dependent methyltransferase